MYFFQFRFLKEMLYIPIQRVFYVALTALLRYTDFTVTLENTYRRGTARRAVLVEILSTAAQLCEKSHLKKMGKSPARVVRWLDHLDAMCSRARRALCAVGSRFNSSRGPGKARPPT